MLTKEPEKLELGPENARRAYWLKRPVLHERANWRRAIAAAGGKFNGTETLLDLLADGVRAVMEGQPEEITEAVLSKVERQRAAVLQWRDALNDKDLARAAAEGLRELSTIEAEVIAGWPPYATAVGDDASYWQIAGIEAARLFLVQWDGLDAVLIRTRAGVADECLAQIPESDLPLLGMFADRLSRIRDAEKKTLNLPQAISPASGTSTSLNGGTSGQSPSLESIPNRDPSVN